MKLDIKEIFRWITFIPVPLIAGPLAGALLVIPFLLYIPSFDTLIDIPTKIILTSTMWIVIYWVGAFLKPKKLPMSTFRVIWIVLITLSVSRFLIQNSFYDWRYQLLEIIIPLSFFPYRGDYPDHETFMRTVNLRIANVLGFLREKRIGYFGWSLPTEFFALYLLLEVIFLTFNGYPFAILSFIGAVALNTSINTTLYSKDPAFKQNPSSKYLMALVFLLVGIFLVRISGINSISVLNFPINLYILPCLLGLTYYPGNELKDFD